MARTGYQVHGSLANDVPAMGGADYNAYIGKPHLQASKYIKDKLSINGYHIKMLRIDPTNWSFTQLFSKIIEYEAAGYEIHSAFIDYLSLIPTVGCINTGPGGTDLRDLFRRVRNYCAS